MRTGRLATLVLTALALAAAPAGARAADTRPPSQVTGVSATAGDAQLTLKWRAATDNVGVTDYFLEHATNAAGPWTQDGSVGTALTGAVTGLANGTTYRFRVYARDAAGNYGPSSWAVTATPQRPPGSVPLGDLPGWQQVFVEDFSTPTTDFPGVLYGAKWWSYPSLWRDTSGFGLYDCARVCQVKAGNGSTGGGYLNLYPHTENGQAYGAAAVPRLPGSTGGIDSTPSGQLYGRYTIRFRADTFRGYKAAWLLWPDSEAWPADGEIDFPEGDFDGHLKGYMHHPGGIGAHDEDTFDPGAYRGAWGRWHIATIEWRKDALTLLLDGQVVKRTACSDGCAGAPRSVDTVTRKVPSTPMHWVLQTETWIGRGLPPATAAGNVQIDWVAVYRAV